MGWRPSGGGSLPPTSTWPGSSKPAVGRTGSSKTTPSSRPPTPGTPPSPPKTATAHGPLLPKNRYVDLRIIPGQTVSSGVKARFGNGATVVVVPNGRSALLYLREDVGLESVVERLVGRRGVDLAAWMDEGWATVRRPGREVRFRPGPGPGDPFGRSW